MNTNYETMLEGFIIQGERYFRNQSYLPGLKIVKERISTILATFEDEQEKIRQEFSGGLITQIIKNRRMDEIKLQANGALEAIKDLSEMLKTMEAKLYDEVKLTGSDLVVQTLLQQEVRAHLRGLDPLQLDSIIMSEFEKKEGSTILDALCSSPLPIISTEQAKAYQRQRGLARHPELENDLSDIELSIGLVEGLKQFAHSIIKA